MTVFSAPLRALARLRPIRFVSDDLTFTGERFVPGIAGEIVYEHVHRYAFARRYAAGKRVLDVACGEGYGSAILAASAKQVTGVDIDAATVAHARERYASHANLSFVEGSATKLPLPDASVDLAVSFETIEHLEEADQPRMLAEIARVLTADGVLVLSAPNRPEYSESRGYVNPFHRREHDRAELEALLDRHFPARVWHAQRVWLGSTLWREGGGEGAEALVGDAAGVTRAPVPPAMYFVVVAARREKALPAPGPAISLFSDSPETELKRAARSAAEAIRLDKLLGERERVVTERDATLATANTHVKHLEKLVKEREALIAERERVVTERDAMLAEANEHVKHLEALVKERESLIAVREGHVTERDHNLSVVNARAAKLEELVADRERLVAERDGLLERANAHVRHLEELCAFREKLVVERDARIVSDDRALAAARAHIAEVESECARLDRALEAQDRIIGYRQSFRWWVALPWMRTKLAWKRLTRE